MLAISYQWSERVLGQDIAGDDDAQPELALVECLECEFEIAEVFGGGFGTKRFDTIQRGCGSAAQKLPGNVISGWCVGQGIAQGNDFGGKLNKSFLNVICYTHFCLLG